MLYRLYSKIENDLVDMVITEPPNTKWRISFLADFFIPADWNHRLSAHKFTIKWLYLKKEQE
jgi:hypothetical protein